MINRCIKFSSKPSVCIATVETNYSSTTEESKSATPMNAKVIYSKNNIMSNFTNSLKKHLIAGILFLAAIATHFVAEAQLGTAPTKATTNVTEAAGYGVVYELNIPSYAAYTTQSAITYAVNNSALSGISFKRVAYFLDLGTTWVWTSMDKYNSTVTLPQLGIPYQGSGILFQQTVNNLHVYGSAGANVTSVTTDGTSGNVEIWPFDYYATASLSNIGGSSSLYDYNDTYSVSGAYSCLQIHNYNAAQTVLAFNNFGAGSSSNLIDLGIGNSTGAQPDWTFANNSGSYTTKTLYILVDNGITPSSQGVCLNATPTSLTVTAAATTGKTIVNYKWYSNTTNSTSGGTLVATHSNTTGTDIYTPLTTSVGTKYYYATTTLSDASVITSSTASAVTVNDLPTITTGSVTAICSGTANFTLPYTATTNNPDQYNITWNAAAVTAGMTNAGWVSFSTSPITIGGIPSTAGNYSGTILVKNSTTGCISASSTTTTSSICATAAENGNLVLTAPAGGTISAITFASYGTPTGSCGSYATSACNAPTSTSVVTSACVGQNTCSIAVNNNTFSDPCNGTVKKMYVQATTSTPTTPTVTFTINAATAITGQPSSSAQTVNYNAAATALSVTATGTGTLTYQWYSNTSNANTGGASINGANSASYTPLTTTAGTLYYYCVVTSSCGTATSNVSGGVTVNAITPAISVMVGTYTYNGNGQGPTAVTGNTGNGAITWSYTGSGCTNYSASATLPSAGGTYTATATVAANGNYGAATSAATAFTIAIPPTFTTNPAALSVGTAASFTVTSTNPCSATNALYMSGTNSVAGASFVTTALDNITMEGWIKWNKTIANANRSIFYNGNTASTGYGIYMSTNGTLSVLIGGVVFATSTAVVTPNIWQHVAIQRNAGTWYVYLNGVVYTTGITSAPRTPSIGTYVGSNSYNTDPFDGNCSNFAVWTVARTTAQIMTDMQGITPTAGLAAYWPLNNTNNDLSGNSNNLTLTNTSYIADAPTASYNWNFGDASSTLASNLAVTHTFTSVGTYTVALTSSLGSSSTSVTVGKGTPTITTAPTATAINYGQTLASSTLSGGIASVPGTFTFSSPTTAPSAGTANQGFTFTPTDATNYASATGTVSVTVNAIAPTISGFTIASKTYGDATFNITPPNSNSIGTFSYSSSNTNVAAISGSTIIIKGAGTATITASQAANGNYSIGSISATLTVNKAGLTITANNQTICFGTAVSTVTGAGSYTVTGYIGSDNATAITGTPTYTTTYTTTTAAGTATITPVVTGLTATNYSFTAASGTITVIAKSTATISGTTAVCLNTTPPNITFTGASGTAPYTFTYKINGAASQTVTTTTGNSVTVAAPTNTVGTFTYTLVSVQDASTTACLQTQSGSAVITVNPYPTASIAGTSEVCKNTTAPNITFTGANATAPYTFTYNVNGGTNTTVTSSGNTATVSAPTTTDGIYTYNLVGVKDASSTTCYQTQTGSAIITIDTLPAATISAASPISFCAGGSVTLTSTPGVSYLWSNSATTASTTISTQGNYTVKVTDGRGCFATSAPTTVTVYALPIVAGSSQPGAFGNGLNFDGIDDYVSTGLNINNKSAFTFEGWINPKSAGSRIGFFGQNDIIEFGFSNSNTMSCWTAASNQINWTFDGTSFPFNSWHHVAIVGDGTALKMYVDGLLKATLVSSTSSYGSSGYNFNIGGAVWDPSGNNFNGSIDEVRVWNVARSQTQIQATMNTQLVGNETGLVAYYNFNQGVVAGNNNGLTTVNDQTVNAYNGTLNNFALTGSSSNWVAGAQSTGGSSALGNVCVNSTLQLTNTTTGGVWSSANAAIATVDNTGLVTGKSAGTVIISYTVTNSNNCTTTVTTSITVNPLPSASISGTTAVCLNGTTPFVTFTGANATAPYTFTYTINGGSPLTVSTTSGNSVTVAAPTGTAGTYTYALVSVQDGSSTACVQSQTGNAVITINPLPTATISGTTAVCLNTTQPNITFTGAAGTAPYTFTYKINSGANQTVTTSTGNSVTVAAPTSNKGTFTYTLVSVQDASTTACLQTQSGSAVITVNPYPTASIAGTSEVCKNTTAPNITFTGANATAPYTFTYNVNGGTITTVTSSGNTATVSAPTTTDGIYFYNLVGVKDASSTTCYQTQTGSAIITIDTLPAATISAASTVSFCAGGSVTLTSTPGVSYLWSNSATTVSTTIATAGNYTVKVTDGRGCFATSAPTTVTVYALPIVAGSSQPGAFGNGLNFDGSNDYVNFNSTTGFNVNTTNQITVEAWLKVVNKSYNFWLSMANDASYRFGSDGNGYLFWDMGQHADRNPNVVSLSSNTWYHVAFVGSKIGSTIKTNVYVNGVLKYTQDEGITSLPNPQLIRFGAGEGVNMFNLNGTMDEVRIWNVARTQAQIQSTMNNELVGNESGLIAYYNFNQGTAGATNTGLTTISDKTTNANNGTLNNFALTGSSSNWVAGAQSNGGSSALGNVCVNSTLQLTNTTTGGVWSSANAAIATVDNTGLVTGKSAGTVIISYTVTNSNNCTTTVTTSITVNPLPSASISGTTAVCLNGTTPFVTFTGANATAPYTFTYTINGGSPLTVTTTSGNSVTVAAPTGTAGTYTYALVSVQDASATACVQTQNGTAVITINPLPTATISGTTTVCLNTTQPNITFTGAAGTAPYTFTYKINGGAIQTLSTATGNNSVTVDAPTDTKGTYIYSLLNIQDASSTACIQNQSGNATITVNPYPTAIITGTNEVCKNSTAPTVTFTGGSATAPYTFTYTINGGNNVTVISSGNTATVSAPTTTDGIYTYSLVGVKDASSSTCYQAQTGSVTVTIDTLPAATISAATPISFCAGGSVTLTSTPGISYLWSNNATTASTTISTQGNYTVKVTDGRGCFATSAPTTVTVYALPIVAGSSQPGAFGNGLDFDGIDDYVSLPSAVYFSGNFTIEAWVYPRDFGNWERIMDFGNGAGNNCVLLSTTYGGGGYPGFYVGGAQFQANTKLVLNQWNHVAATLNGTTATIYVNGVASGTATFPVPANVVRTKCYLGKSNWGDPNLNGKMDEFRIWNTALTQAQIQATMNTQLVGNETGLVAYYNFNQGVVAGNNNGLTTVNDQTVNAYNGSLNNFGLTGSSSNWVAGAQSTGGSSALGNVCVNSTLQLTNTTTGGVWTSANTAIATVDNTGLVTGKSAGTVIISYTVTNSNNCITTVTTSITVNPLPTASISGTITVKKGDPSPTVTFTGGNGTAPYTFTYTINGGASLTVTSTGNTATISAPTNIPGAFDYALVSVKDASASTCINNAIGVATVTINPLQGVISGTTSVCQNDVAPIITIVGSYGTSPYTFTYNINGGATLSVTSVGNTATIIVPTGTAGSYSYNLLSVQDASALFSATSSSGTATVTIKLQPTITISGPTYGCGNGSTVSYTAGGGVSYLWDTGLAKPSATNTFTTINAYTAHLIVTAANGCTNTASQLISANTAPTITALADQTTLLETAIANNFTMGDAETPGNLTLKASSSNTTLIPNSNIVVTGTGLTRKITATPAQDMIGTDTVTVAVTDCGGLSVTTSYVVTVNEPQYPSGVADFVIRQTTSLIDNCSDSVYFINRSYNGPGASYQWYINGTLSNLPSFLSSASGLLSYKTSLPGTYTALLVVTEPGLPTYSVTKSFVLTKGIVPVPSPSFSFGYININGAGTASVVAYPTTPYIQGGVVNTWTVSPSRNVTYESLIDAPTLTITQISNPQIFNVTLTEYATNGCARYSTTQQVVIPAYSRIIPNYSVTHSPSLIDGCNDSVTFINNSVGGVGGNTYTWYLGDGTTIVTKSTAPIGKVYTYPGTYNVLMNATDTTEQSVSKQFTITTTGTIPAVTAIALVNTSSDSVSTNVLLNGGASTIAYGGLHYVWSVVNNNNSMSTYHTANVPLVIARTSVDQVFTAQLTVTDTTVGCKSNTSAMKTFTVPMLIPVVPTPAPIVADFLINVTKSKIDHCNDSVYITNKTTGGAGTLTYTWYFGDGTSINTTDASVIGKLYNYSGTYTVLLNVTDTAGQSATKQFTVTTVGTIPAVVANIALYGPANGTTLSTILLNGGNSYTAHDSLTYVWSVSPAVGGASVYTTSSISFSIDRTNSDQNYIAQLTVSDALTGCRTSRVAQSFTIPKLDPIKTPPAVILPNFSIHHNSSLLDGCNDSITFVNNTANDAGKLTFNWYFGDGLSIYTKTTAPIGKVYIYPGTYTVLMIASDSTGQSVSKQLVITTTGTIPVVTSIPIVYASSDSVNTYVLMNGSNSSIAYGGLSYSWIINPTVGGIVSYDSANVALTIPRVAVDQTFTAHLKVTDTTVGCRYNIASQTFIVPKLIPAVTIPAPIVADFSINVIKSQVDHCNDSVYITNNTSGGVGTLIYTWYLGDGTTINTTDPNVIGKIYNYPGTYTVFLNVADTIGQTASKMLTVTTIGTVPAVTANIALYGPLNATSISNVILNGGNSYTAHDSLTYRWSVSPAIAGVRNYTTTSISLPINRTGADQKFTAHLTVSDALSGCRTSDATQSFIIPKLDPVYVAPTAIIPDYTVHVRKSIVDPCSDSVYIVNNTTGGDGTLTYTWYLGDGTAFNTTSKDTFGKLYSYPGYYTVLLNVIDTAGQTSSLQKSFTTIGTIPTINANAIIYGPYNSDSSSLVTLDGGNSNIAYGTLNYYWTVSPTIAGVPAYPSSNVPLTINRTNADQTFTATLTVKDAGTSCKTSTASQTFIVPKLNPADSVYPLIAADFSVSVTKSLIDHCNDSVNFVNNTTGGAGNLTYTWYFGDGSMLTTTSNAVIGKVYTFPGTYTILLNVKDSMGYYTSVQKRVYTVGTIPTPTAMPMLYGPNNTATNSNVLLTGANSFIAYDSLIYNWTITPTIGGIVSYNTDSVTFTIARTNADQFYTAILTVSDALTGCRTSSASKTFVIPQLAPVIPTAAPIVANFTINVTKSLIDHCNDSIYITNNTTGGAGKLNYTWYLGDGTSVNTTSANAIGKVYTLPGTYTIVLNVSDTTSQYAAVQKTVVTVGTIPAVIANAIVTGPNNTDTTTSSFLLNGGNSFIAYDSLTYSWSITPTVAGVDNFNAASIPLTINRTNADQTYTATLTVSDALTGCKTSTASQTFVVPQLAPAIPVAAPIVANFTIKVTKSLLDHCNDSVYITNNTTGGAGALKYTWYLGDGTSVSTTSANAIGKVYTLPGTYTIQLNVTDTSGQNISIQQTVTTVGTIPAVTAVAVIYGPNNTDTTSSFILNAGNSYTSNGLLTYLWTITPVNGIPITLNTDTASLLYNRQFTDQSFTAILTVQDSLTHCRTSTISQIYLVPMLPGSSKYASVPTKVFGSGNYATVYPNPSKSNINLRVSLANEIDGAEVSIFNAMSMNVVTYKLNTGKTKEIKSNISVATLAPGIYYLKVFSNKGEQLSITKFVKL